MNTRTQNGYSWLGDILSVHVTSRGWTQARAAEKLGMTTSHFSKLFRKEAEPSLSDALRLNAVFGIRIDMLCPSFVRWKAMQR